MDLALLDHLANHPDIHPWVSGSQRVDVAHLDVPGALLVGDRDGAVFFKPTRDVPSYFEMHYLFTQAVRGKQALALIRQACTTVFTDHGAEVICGAVPREHRASRVMSRALGARPLGPHTDSLGRACIFYVLEREPWATSSAASSAALAP